MYLDLSRFSVGGVLYLTCILLPLAWWRQHDVTSIAKWHGQASSWLLAIWHSLIAKSSLAIWQSCITKALLKIWCSCIAKWCWKFGNILLLSSNDRVTSFYWIRGSKQCFLTSFSHLNHYFLFLVSLHNCYLLVYLRLSWLHGYPISHSVFSYLWYSKVLNCTCTPIFLAHITRFLEARRSREPGIRFSTGFLSPFRLLPKVSHANIDWPQLQRAPIVKVL